MWRVYRSGPGPERKKGGVNSMTSDDLKRGPARASIEPDRIVESCTESR
jgi:hypothetical protein